MASLNTSSNGPSISSSYQKVVNSPAPTGAAASSATYGQWAVFSVQAPLISAFQSEGNKESVLKVQTTGEGELSDLIEEFSDGRIQFAFVKVKDPNTTLPKSVLVAWCGEGVPERTKGYFTSHLNAAAKILHGYHVQITARSDRDLTPESIIQKVQDASGAKYSGGGSSTTPSSRPPPAIASKPIMPTKSFAASSFQPLGGRSRNTPATSTSVDADGWGQDAPPVTRSQLEKVAPAYKPTQVNMAALQSQHEPSRFQAAPTSSNPDLIKGGYQPIGKVDINAIRQQARENGQARDERPTVVKGSYEPIGKVDIAEIRRKAQAPESSQPQPQPPSLPVERPQQLSQQLSGTQSGERLTSLPKPQIAGRFGTNTSSFAGTNAPAPGGFVAKSLASAAPVGVASRTFADQGGKTPAQQWEEKRRARGLSGATETVPPSSTTSALNAQPSGGWQSAYGGKKWDVQVPSRTGGSAISDQKTGPQDDQHTEEPSQGFNAAREAFANAPPPLDTTSKPSNGVRGVPMPGLPQRPKNDEVPAEQHQTLPPPPPRPQPEEEEEEDEEPVEQGSPVRIAMPVARGQDTELEKVEQLPPRPVPTATLAQVADSHRDPEPEPRIQDEDPARGAAQAAAVSTFGHADDSRSAGTSGGKEAIAQYDYEKAEDNELELHEGERITNIDMVDDDWWMGQNSRGESGLFPSNYVELVESANTATSHAAPVPVPSHIEAAPPAGPPQPTGKGLPTATAQYDYEAAEDNELSFPEGAKITDVEFPDDDWWSGRYQGKEGLFPANYVELDQ